MGENYEQQPDGTWKKATPIPYYPNIFERIWNWIRRLMKINLKATINLTKERHEKQKETDRKTPKA